jgi:hypothetical protein
MSQTTKGQSQWRATFEDVKKDQKKLREKLDELIKENRPIKDEKERTLLLDVLIPNATLGLGTFQSHTFQFPFQGSGNFDNLEYWIRRICYLDSSIVPRLFLHDNQKQEIPIKFIWEKLRDELFLVYPMALNKAASISKEQTHLGPSEAGKV